VIVADSQIHIWEAGTPPPNHRQDPFGVDDLLREMLVARVDRAVLVPPLWDPAGNEYSIKSAARHPERFVVMGLVNLLKPMDADSFREWLNQNGLCGIRISFNSPALRAVLTSGHADWLWKSAEGAGAPVMILAPHLSAFVGLIARQHPALKIVVDHMAIPRGLKAPAAFAHLPELKALAKYSNVAVKMGGVPNYANDAYPHRSLHGYLRQVIDAFGTMRCFWGSDFSRLVGSYAECVSMFRDELDWLTVNERAAIMGLGLCKWLNWSTSPDA
jgi:L-fuconolactonase